MGDVKEKSTQESCMIRKVIVRPEAERELVEAHRWYARQYLGLGHAFLLSIDAAIQSICREPELYACIHKNIRRALVRRFPYGVFYLIDYEQIVVVAIFHVRRNPSYLRFKA
jgi:plasmid stabilization system protein ParE